MSELFETQFAYSPTNQQLIKGAKFTVHDVDSGEPLPTMDALGSPLQLSSDSVGTIPPFKVAGDRVQVEIRNGAFKTVLTTTAGVAARESARVFEDGIADPESPIGSALTANTAQSIAGDEGYAGSPQQAVDERVTEVGAQAFVGRRDLEISAAEFGVRGDGTDETAEMQAFLTWIASHGAHGVVPFREVRISSPLVIPNERGWKLRGMGRFRGTNLIQTTPNVPILRIGVGGSGSLRDWTVEDICLTFDAQQPAASTGALCIKFESMPYQYGLRNVNFRNGYYGVGYAAGVGGGWGGDWDGIVFSGMSGGWYDMSGTINGVPNNRFGRIYGDANGATDYLFKQWRGYNTTVETIEVINYNGGLGLLDFTTQSVFIIGTFKLEGGSFTLPSVDLVRIPAGAFIRFGEFTLRDTNGGLVINPSSGDCSVFALGAGGTSVATLEIGVLNAQATSLLNGYLFRGAQRTTQVFIRRLERALWKIANTGGGTAMNENIVIDQWMNKRLSVNKGDAGLTVLPGETEGTLFFETPLTAQRDIILPSDTKDLIGGLQYRVYVATNVINGTNHLRLVIPGTRTVYSKTTSTAEVITVEWRRNTNGANGWVVTGVSPA